MLSGGVRCVSDEQVRHRQRRKDAAAQTAWTKGQHTDSGIWRADIVHAFQTSKRGEVPQFCRGVFVGMLSSSSEAVVVTEQESAIKTRAANVRIVPGSETWSRIEYSECEQFRGCQMAATQRSTFKLEWGLVPQTKC